MLAMSWDPQRFELLVKVFGVSGREIAKRAGKSPALANALSRTKEPKGSTLEAIAQAMGVGRQWLETGYGESRLPLPRGLLVHVESQPTPERMHAILYAISVNGGGLLTYGREWSSQRWGEQLDRLTVTVTPLPNHTRD